jgi:RNA polymerase sigma-70 factor, ECF subfamily
MHLAPSKPARGDLHHTLIDINLVNALGRQCAGAIACQRSRLLWRVGTVNMTGADDVPLRGVARVEVDFDDFYSRTRTRMVSLAVSLTGDWAAAEDLIQDAYEAASRRWTQVSTYDDPAAWVRRVVLNRATSRWRRRGRELVALNRLLHANTGRAEEVDPFDSRFWLAVRALPSQQRKAIALRYVEDLAVIDVAHALGCSEGAAKTHLHRARTTLFEQFGANYLEADHA